MATQDDRDEVEDEEVGEDEDDDAEGAEVVSSEQAKAATLDYISRLTPAKAKKAKAAKVAPKAKAAPKVATAPSAYGEAFKLMCKKPDMTFAELRTKLEAKDMFSLASARTVHITVRKTVDGLRANGLMK